MKKFFATATNGVFATTVSASNVLSTEGLAQELVRTALTEGKNFVIGGDAKVAQDVQEMFMTTVNDMLNAAEEIGNNDALDQMYENGHLAKEVYEWLVDTLEARKNPVLEVAVPTEQVVIAKGINMSVGQVIAAMATRGLAVNGSCKTAANEEGTVLGFEVTPNVTLATVRLATGIQKFAVQSLKGNAVIEVQTKTNEEVSTMTNTNKSVNVNSAVEAAKKVLGSIDPAIQASVDEALKSGVPAFELSAQQREAMQEHKLATDLAKFAEKQEEKEEKATELANSEIANQLLAVLGGAPTSNVSAQAPAEPVRQASAPVINATPNTNTNKGGNVSMKNTNNATVFAPAQAVSATQAPAARQSAGLSITAGLAGGSSLQLNPALVAQQQATQSGSLRAWGSVNDQFKEVVGEYDAFVGRQSNGQSDFVWYIEDAKNYEGQILSGSDLAANGMTNPALGITDIQFYNVADVYAARSSKLTVRPEDYMIAEVFFGMTSYEFLIRRGSYTNKTTNQDVAFIYSPNVLRKKNENTGSYFCEYQNSRRTDVLDVVVDAEGKVRMARKEFNRTTRQWEINAADAPFVQQVGGANYVESTPGFGVKIGKAVFVQVMVLFDELTGLKATRDAKAQA